MEKITLDTFFYLSPITILMLTALFALMLDVLSKKPHPKLVLGISVFGVCLAGVAAVELWLSEPLYLFHNSVRVDRYSMFFTLLSLFLTLLTLFNVYPLMKDKGVPTGELFFFILACCTGMSLMAWSTDLITLFVSLEIMSLAVYILTGIQKYRQKATEGAFKYFLLGAFSTGFLLYGISFIYAAVGSTHYAQIAEFFIQSRYTIPTILYIGVALLFVGFAFKIAAVPFHMWVPDVYDAAHPSITGFMATGVKAAAFAALVRFYLVALYAFKSEWVVVCIGLAVLTMTIGNIAALIQKNIKRMLAYSSIAHAGYILVAVAAATSQAYHLSVGSILFYLISYGLMTIGSFAVVAYVTQQQDLHSIEDFAGFGFSHPYLGIAMTIFMLSLTGIPLTAGFIGKYFIFSAALKSGLYLLTLIAVLNSAIAAYYYLRIVVIFYMKPGEAVSIPTSHPITAVIAVTSIGTLLLGILPSWWIALIKNSIAGLF